VAALVPPVSLKLDLEAKAGPDKARPTGRRKGSDQTSWWTARATAGEVKGGFTKEEILRRPEANPRGEGGMFSRLEELLSALG
jgi:hypothetical protein